MVAFGGTVTRNVPAPVPALRFTAVNAHATYITSRLIVKVMFAVVIRVLEVRCLLQSRVSPFENDSALTTNLLDA